MKRELYAWRGDELIGCFVGGHRSTTFSYEPNVTVPISFSMPLGEKIGSKKPYRFLENLLPEDAARRRRMATVAGVDADDVFDLLSSVDTVGGLVFTKTANPKELMASEPVIMSREDFESQVTRLHTTTFPIDEVDGRERFSIAGQQGKFTAARHGKRWYWPSTSLPSTHIFKPDEASLPDVSHIEHACMVLARKMGCTTPNNEVVKIAGVNTYYIGRFDRGVDSDGIVRRLHVEDLCQALGLYPSDKYSIVPKRVAALFRENGMSEQDIRLWFDQLICNVMLGNCDAHGKNYSIFLTEGEPSPCPLYDCVSTMVWPRFNKTLAMAVNGKTLACEVGLGDWRQEAACCDLDADGIEADVRRMFIGLQESLPEVLSTLQKPLAERLEAAVKEANTALVHDV